MFNNEIFAKPRHPQAEAAKNMGIISLVCLGAAFFCGCTGIIAIIIGFMAMAKAKTVKTDFFANPGMYHPDSLQQADLARTLGLIGAIIGIVFNLLGIAALCFILLMEYIEKMS